MFAEIVWFPSQGSTTAHSADRLLVFLVAVTGAVGVLVAVLLIGFAIRYRHLRRGLWVLGAVGVLVATWHVSRLTAPSPGSLEDAFLRVRRGMSQWKAVTILGVADKHIDCVYLYGKSKDGKSLSRLCIRGFADLPAAADIERAKIELLDSGGDCFTVLLGQRGVVRGKRFTPSGSSRSLSEWVRRLQLRLASL
jgi:hypothetical protein